jgi:hypothetical protein
MGPGMLAGTYLPQEIRFNVKKMVEIVGASFWKIPLLVSITN